MTIYSKRILRRHFILKWLSPCSGRNPELWWFYDHSHHSVDLSFKVFRSIWDDLNLVSQATLWMMPPIHICFTGSTNPATNCADSEWRNLETISCFPQSLRKSRKEWWFLYMEVTLFSPWSVYFHLRRHFSCSELCYAIISWKSATSNRLKPLKIVQSAGIFKEQK